MSIKEALKKVQDSIESGVTLVAVSKTHAADVVMQAYDEGVRIFGENKVQEMCAKAQCMPSDIEWHLIGHLQSNKIKYIASFVSMIQSVDSMALLEKINAAAIKAGSFCSASYFLRSLLVSEEYHAWNSAAAVSVESFIYKESSLWTSRVSPA